MRTLWTHRDIDAPADVVWELLTDVTQWPRWGPSVRHARLDGDRLAAGVTGEVTTVVGLRLPFVITAFEPGSRWDWDVAGVPATRHAVAPLGQGRCRAGFGVPWPAAPYLAICRLALARLDGIARQRGATRTVSDPPSS